MLSRSKAPQKQPGAFFLYAVTRLSLKGRVKNGLLRLKMVFGIWRMPHPYHQKASLEVRWLGNDSILGRKQATSLLRRVLSLRRNLELGVAYELSGSNENHGLVLHLNIPHLVSNIPWPQWLILVQNCQWWCEAVYVRQHKQASMFMGMGGFKKEVKAQELNRSRLKVCFAFSGAEKVWSPESPLLTDQAQYVYLA